MRSQWGLVLAFVAGGALIFAACAGDGDGGDEGDGIGDDQLAGAIVAEILADPEAPFGEDRVSAECFASELVSSIGTDRLGALGFSVDSVPDELHADWSVGEVDAIIEDFEGCIDVAAVTRSTVLMGVSEDLVDCVLGEVGDRFYLDVLRAELGAGTDETAIDAAVDTATAPFRDAVDACGEASPGDDAAGPSTGDEFPAVGEPDPSELPDAAAPLGLGEVRLPDDSEAVQVLFDALPEEVSAGIRGDIPAPSGEQLVVYGSTRGCAPAALRAGDLSALPDGFYPPGWSAEWEVALFATGADWEVEAAGRDRGTFWATWNTTCGGDGFDASEVFAATWGAEGGSWVFTAASAEAADRDELIAAFVAAAPTGDVVDDADGVLARAALLKRTDLGSEWSSLPRSVNDDPAADAAARAALEAEPACSTAVEQAEQIDIPVTELLELLVPDAPARAESPSFTHGADGTSNVEHTVSVLGAPEDVAARFGSIGDIGWPECMLAGFDDLLQAGFDTEGNGVTVTEYSAVKTPVVFGDDGFGARFFFTLDVPEGDTAELTFDLSVVGVGRVLSAVSQLSVDGAIDDLDAFAALAHRRVEAEFR